MTLANSPILNTADPDIFESSITVRWSAPGNPGDTEYKVEISTIQTFPSNSTSSASVTGLFHNFNNLVSNRKYYARVSAVNREGIWAANLLFDTYQTKPAPPVILPFGKPVSTTTADLNLGWSANGNDGATYYDTRSPPSLIWDTPNQVLGRTFPGLLPNKPYSFEVRAKDINLTRLKDAVSVTTTVYTRAQPADPFEYGNVTDLDTWEIRIASKANDPNTTEYAFQFEAVGSPTPSFHDRFLVYSGGNAVPSAITDINNTSVWRTLAQWGLLDAGTGRYVINGDNLPSENHHLKVFVRNGDKQVEAPSYNLIEPQSGTPRVELTVRGATVTAAQSWQASVFVSSSVIPFRASGSSHFNILMSSVLSDSTTFSNGNYTSVGQGWNGVQKDTAYCSDDSINVNPTYVGPLQGVCVPGEDRYFLHIVGDKMSATGNPSSPIYPGDPSFRIYVDLTPPQAGPIDAQWAGFVIPDNGGTLGFQTIDFSWPVIDLGHPVSRSPIVGWAYRFVLNDNSLDPVQSTTTRFVAGPAVRLALSSAEGSGGVVPATGTYYFKAIGLDLAGNWQSAPTSFTYNFKEDSLPPSFKGVSLAGAKMPKSDYHYAAVDPSAPIRLIFSEPMNLASPGALSFIQTHNALGQQVNATVTFTSTATVADGSTTYMDVTANVPLERGARYEILSSTSNLRDLGGNRMSQNQQFSVTFFTQIDPNAATVFVTLDNGARLDVSANAFGADPSGVAFDDDVRNDPAPIGAAVRGASGAVSRRSGGDYNQVLATKEFNHYASDGTRLTAPFRAPVTLTFSYPDADGNGIVDGTESGHPVKVDRLAIYALDELSGAWMKLPGSRVDTALRQVSVDLRHFSVYALIGTASFDLTEAHPFPVPYRAAKDAGGIVFSFPNSQIAKVQVFTLDGRLVKTLSDDTGAGFVRWDPVNTDGGDPVASDVYLYVIENDQERKVGKLMVIR
ncbi:MAG: fibronectin type III domain-containing protein [Elusimicrobia bacterium]|nr:fibronectin type III domain-containing protein [Elusimicrobiota bacterium]